MANRHDEFEDVFSSSQGEDFVDIAGYSQGQKTNAPKHMSNAKGKTRSSKGKKKKRSRKPWLIALGCILVIVGIVFGVFQYFLGGLQTDHDFTKDESALGIGNNPSRDGRNVVNIALFGVDSRDHDHVGRSDATMVLSLDMDNGDIKLTSILRDSYVAIEGHGYDKLAHAFAYGNATLAVKTLNQNFNLDIKDYICVNFDELAQIIDMFGGVDIEINEDERQEINRISREVNSNSALVESTGNVHLNGEQATAYARIRSIDSDVMRANRQRTVLEALFQKLKSTPKSDYPGLVRQILPLVKTSLDYGDIIGMLPIMFSGDGIDIIQHSVPTEEDEAIGGLYEGAWVWRYDLEAAAARLNEFIYGSSTASADES